jgi:hypothetical protein
MADADGFLARWSRRKAGARIAEPVPDPAEAMAIPQAPVPLPEPRPAADVAPAPPLPTMDEAQALTPGSDFSRFVARDVDGPVRNAALKTLFSDPHFNVMDGLDTYIDDYGVPDPLPPGMLEKMVQGQFLGLFKSPDDTPEGAPLPALPTPVNADAPDEDPDLRLQPDNAPGRPGPEPCPEPDAGRQP